MFEEFSLDKEFDEEIDLTPLIDVVFILLVFFFITSTFIQPALPVNLAKAASASVSAGRKEQVVISIDAEGALFHDGQSLTIEEVPRVLNASPEQGINLFIDRAAPFEAFLSVIDETRLLGRDDVSITTLPAGRE